LHGLHAAHEAKNERGEPLGIVHRDVSPQNILVGIDGVARVLDFGIAKAAGRAHVTRDRHVKGKLSYMAPEQFEATIVDRRTDVYAAAVVLWEALTGKRLFLADNEANTLARVLTGDVPAPSSLVPEVSAVLDRVVLRGLERDANRRFATARDMALAIEACGPLATPSAVGEWVESSATSALAERARHVEEVEQVNDLPFVPVSSHPPPFAVEPARAVELPTIVTPTPSSSSTPGGAAADAGAPAPDAGLASLDLPGLTRSRSRRHRPAAIAGLTVLAVLLLLWAARVRQPSVVGSREPSSPEVSVARSAVSRPPAQAESPARDEPAATLASVQAVPPPAPPATNRTVAVRPSTPTRAKPRPRPNCDPPYTLDDQGHRHYKMECL
jgi:serine/threonine-protein kinase